MWDDPCLSVAGQEGSVFEADGANEKDKVRSLLGWTRQKVSRPSWMTIDKWSKRMIIVIESVVLCLVFTVMVYFMSREPIKSLYNYPPKIQERVRTLSEYKDQIPAQKNKLAAKLGACVLFIVVLSLILRYVNGCTTFLRAFGTGFLLWTIVNLWDALVLDILWFCHDPHFVFKGTEDMVSDYHDYWFHIKGFFIGEGLALAVCALAGLVVQFVLG